MVEPVLLDAGDRAFYDAPDPLPAGEHGDLVRYQLTGDQPEGLTRYRVMYLSETVSGQPTVVTGLVSVPDGEPPEGGWPVLTYARGSSGIADDCAISMAVDGTRDADPVLAAEALLVEHAVATHRMVGTVTDYEGLGGPGMHSFLGGVSEARAVLDIVRAAAQLPDLELRTDVGIMGYSQGGHAAVWANQEAEEWTPELQVHGTVAGAPASEVLTSVVERRHNDLSLALLLAGMAHDDPDLDLDEVLTADGHRFVEHMSQTCRGDRATIEELARTELLRERPEALEHWREGIEANVAGGAPGASPVLLVHGDADVNVPPEHSEVPRERMCAAGVPTERRLEPGLDHLAGAVPTVADGAEWLAGRIDGTVAPPTC